jgi:hypothetical protein
MKIQVATLSDPTLEHELKLINKYSINSFTPPTKNETGRETSKESFNRRRNWLQEDCETTLTQHQHLQVRL